MPSIQGAVKNAIVGLLRELVGVFADWIDILYGIAADYLTKTPHPNNLSSFNPPTKGIWTELYAQLYQGKVVILLPTLFSLALGLAMFLNIFSEKQKKQSIRRAVFAYPLAISWWWFGGWFLKFTNDLANYLVAGASLGGSLEASLGTSLSAVVLGLLVYTFGATVILVIIAIYLLRQIAIFAYMVAMPLLLMFWVVPVDPVQGWAKSMMGKFVPLVLMTLPTALLLRIGAMFLGSNGSSTVAASSSSGGGLEEQLISLVLGLATIAGAAAVPKYMFSFSSGVSRAVRTGTRTGVSAVRGARAGGAPERGGRGGGAAAAAGQGRAQQQASGSESGETADKYKHNPEEHLDFRPARGRRRGQQKRAAKVGSAAQTAAKKSVGGAARASRSALRNKNKEGSTLRGMGSDAKEAAKQGTSKRMQRIEQRMAVRRDEIQEKFTPDGDGTPSRGQSSLDDYAGPQPDTDADADTNTGSDVEITGSASSGKSASSSSENDSSPSTNEPATGSQPTDAQMESGDLSESSEEWSRSDARTADFSTNTQDRQSGEDAAGEESSDD